MPASRPSPALTRLLFAVGLLLGMLAAGPVRAADPVIPPGKGQVVLELVEPHRLGAEVEDGWALQRVQIQRRHIDLEVINAAGDGARLRLQHPDAAPGDALRSPSFAVTLDPPAGAHVPALQALHGALQANDDGTFWGAHAVDPGSRTPARAGKSNVLTRARYRARRFFGDGVVHIGVILLILGGLTTVILRRAPRSVGLWLAGIVAAGAVVRLWLSPRVALAVWPYSRLVAPFRRIFEGDLYWRLVENPVDLVDLVPAASLTYALLAPLAIFVHARYLLGSDRRALLAAGFLALLPLHIRFSASDVAFIPSITVSATSFALIHAGTRETSRIGRVAALAALMTGLVLVYEARPLNIMYAPLLLGACMLPGKDRLDWPWVGAATAVVALMTALVGVPELLGSYGPQVEGGLSPPVLIDGFGVLFDPTFNILLNPTYSPPLYLAALGAGVVTMWRGGERLRNAFLLLWLLLFLWAHAYVVPREVANQARYHLHLVAPYLMLTAVGAGFVLERFGRPALVAIVAYAALAPILHGRAITDVGFMDQQEYLFVLGARDRIPDGCVVAEYVGDGAGARFDRMGQRSRDGERAPRWTVIPIGDGEVPDDGRPRPREQLPGELPECLFLYEGLTCYARLPGAPEAIEPRCADMKTGLVLEEVGAVDLEHPVYDHASYPALAGGRTGPIPLRLWRVAGRR